MWKEKKLVIYLVEACEFYFLINRNCRKGSYGQESQGGNFPWYSMVGSIVRF